MRQEGLYSSDSPLVPIMHIMSFWTECDSSNPFFEIRSPFPKGTGARHILKSVGALLTTKGNGSARRRPDAPECTVTQLVAPRPQRFMRRRTSNTPQLTNALRCSYLIVMALIARRWIVTSLPVGPLRPNQ